jgi:CubicO group peptidase (beta-lactamase class C family)
MIERAALLGDFDALVEEAMAEWQVPALGVAILHRDETVLLKAYGQRDVEANLPATLETQFAICSLTKSFTAAGLGMLVDERKLDWDAKVRDYVPEFRLHDPVASDHATLRDLLCHRSGLPRHDWVHMPGDLGPADMLARLKYLEPSREFRTEFQYRNLGYMVAGIVAERVSGQTWEDFTHARLLQPLGIENASFSVETMQQQEDAARPYIMVGEERRRAAYWPIRATPAGAINASIADMAKYLRFHLDGGKLGDSRLLSAASVRAMRTPLILESASEFSEVGDVHYGLGLGCGYYRGHSWCAHGGGWIGWSSLIYFFPEKRIGVLVLTNRAANPVPQLLTFIAFERLCGLDAINWLGRFRERKRDALAQEKLDKEARAGARRPGTRPSHSLADYPGEYEHPAYGRFVVEAGGDLLTWRWRGLSGDLLHRHYDVFEIAENPGTLSPGLMTVTFGYDREGIIDRLSMPLEPMVADIVFRRIGSDLPDADVLQSCVGIYRYGPTRHVVSIDADGQLTLSPTGQPTYRLKPYQGAVFEIDTLPGFRLEFRQEPSGIVETIVFHQPNGTFVARRADLSSREDAEERA